MKYAQKTFWMLFVAVFCGSCATVPTRITSSPEGASISIDSNLVGTTPFTAQFSNKFGPWVSWEVRAEKEGFEPDVRILSRGPVHNSRYNIPESIHFVLRPLPVSTLSKILDAAPSTRVASDIDELPSKHIKSNKNAHAIVIGVERYRQKLPNADFAAQDAKLVTDYMTKVLGYPEDNVITLTNEHASNVDLVKYFEKWLPNNVEPDSTVFVYYSGHGAPNPKTGDAYLVPYDGDPSFIDETGYSLKRMYDALGKLPAREIIVALDSCFSGAGGRSVLAKGARPIALSIENPVLLSNKITVLSASAGDQISSTYDEKGHGLFTYFLLRGIKNEEVVKQDGSLKVKDLFNYIKPQVESIARKKYNNEQTPQIMGAKDK